MAQKTTAEGLLYIHVNYTKQNHERKTHESVYKKVFNKVGSFFFKENCFDYSVTLVGIEEKNDCTVIMQLMALFSLNSVHLEEQGKFIYKN